MDSIGRVLESIGGVQLVLPKMANAEVYPKNLFNIASQRRQVVIIRTLGEVELSKSCSNSEQKFNLRFGFSSVL